MDSLEARIREIVREELRAEREREKSLPPDEPLKASKFAAERGLHPTTVAAYCKRGFVPNAYQNNGRGHWWAMRSDWNKFLAGGHLRRKD